MHVDTSMGTKCGVFPCTSAGEELAVPGGAVREAGAARAARVWVGVS